MSGTGSSLSSSDIGPLARRNDRAFRLLGQFGEFDLAL